MMFPGVETEELAIKRVRDHGDRMPIGTNHTVPGPLKPGPSQAVAHMGVFEDEEMIIPIHKIIMETPASR